MSGFTVCPECFSPADEACEDALCPRTCPGTRLQALIDKPRVLVACEYSATVRDAFRARGFDAWSCDLLPTEGDPRWHIQGDAIEAAYSQRWDMLIAHPPCTYLSRAGARWWKNAERRKLADQAAEFVFALHDAPVQHIAIENPIGQLNSRWRYPDQTIQPWEYGHPFSKATCLWLKNLPPLMPTSILADHRPLIRSNVTATKRAGKPQRGVLSGGLVSAVTFPGIAAAMADQWGAFLKTSLLNPEHEPAHHSADALSLPARTETSPGSARQTVAPILSRRATPDISNPFHGGDV